ncbi:MULTISPECIES: rhodanese-like domain-containing protein [unclassified Curtobacterium]|jgi:rhodanese-related sulfurtransferase|uniref:rhodanese-like domain-containing protein n=1 Tax=unclassified Curtobacterium TaxID=257496 RepID=UPI0008E8F34C|nr:MULTISPECIES: rhodanese-like domain-containing protein [unclassified Curtobacterium]MCC8908096.1 rhodanese-like domain-containing protein [Curtobacterium sp. GD1]MDR6171630.1 rhodanese-related sulfurtransferase [Curtobacterium sp. SORGH_AS_0776]SFF78262.1 Rhodanese-related sulfurtransferase [Curtobacterium sp. YR515]
MPAEIVDIDVAEARRRIDAGARLFDVREQGEWDEVHAPEATLVPMSELVARWKEIDGGDEPAIIVCHSGGRSARVVAALEQSGVPAVNLVGGMVAWEQSGAPVVRDAQGEPRHEH